MNPALRHLQLFDAIATTGGVSAAARKLGISQPAVSLQLRALERSLGVRLVDRDARGTRLTEIGASVAERCRRMVNAAEDVERVVSRFRGLTAGRLTIGASTTVAIYRVPDVLVWFKKQHPEVVTRLEIGMGRDLAAQVAAGEIDVAFAETAPQLPSLKSKILAHEQLAPIVAASHPLAGRRSVTIEEFCRERFIARDTRSETRSFVERVLRAKDVSPQVAMTLPSTEAIKRAVAAGLGVSIVSRVAIELELQAGLLKLVPLKGLSIRRPLYRLTRDEKGLSPAARVFSEAFERSLKPLPPGRERV